MKSQGHMTPPKDYNNLVPDPKDMKICELPNKKI